MSGKKNKKIERSKINIMSDEHDTLVETLIFKTFRPKVILELGTGTGSWCAHMNQHTLEYDKKFYMTDDFSYTIEPHLKHFIPKNSFWPKNEQEFHKSIMAKSPLIDYAFYNKDYFFIKESILDTIDFLRIDCDSPYQKENIQHIINKSGDDLIILVDDVRPNSCIDRLLVMTEFMYTNELKLFWTGGETAAWCKTSMNTENFYEAAFQNFSHTFNTMYIRDNYQFNGINQNHLITNCN